MCLHITRNKLRLLHNITHYDYMHNVTRKKDMSVSVYIARVYVHL